ncbi:uncharacterized protein LOC132275187 [Cornus florida]|uniref:uncharacterized protein LOC132275187 n=1 Tax=Cornus florida TaxID=4283 RepID=UPI0028A16EBE|nr:uncharacterized protein LOC132275187 [Cornus florida]
MPRILYKKIWGIGFDGTTFKVVHISFGNTNQMSQVSVFTPTKNRWHLVRPSPHDYSFSSGHGVYFKQSIYWIAKDGEEEILSVFHLPTETFTRVQTPCHETRGAGRVDICLLKGRPAIFMYVDSMLKIHLLLDENDDRASWSNFEIKIPKDSFPIKFLKNDILLLKNEKLILYNLESKGFEPYDVANMPNIRQATSLWKRESNPQATLLFEGVSAGSEG